MTAPATSVAAYYTLDAAYRAATANQAIAVVRALALRWSSVDGDDLAGTSEIWLRDGIESLLAGQRNARALANAYTTAVRGLAAPNAPLFTPPVLDPPSVEQIQKSLSFTAFKQTGQELGRLQAVRRGEVADASREERESAQRSYEGRKRQILTDGIVRAAGAAIRHVTTAGHEQLIANVESDKLALGWARTTKPGCCYWCAMLASRGYVYKKDSFAASNAKFTGIGEQKVHDNCGCGLRPVYNTVDPLPDRTEVLEQMWIDMSRETGKTGAAAITEFRHRYEASELAKPLVAA